MPQPTEPISFDMGDKILIKMYFEVALQVISNHCIFNTFLSEMKD